jgi:uncharacterized damage-inducible protein DinB
MMTMSEIERIREQMRRAVHGDAWHGPAVLELVAGLTAKQAAAHPLPGAHSIWELVHHITAWATIARRRIEDSAPIDVTTEVDWPLVSRVSDAAWKAAVAALAAAHADLDAALAGLDDAALEKRALGSTTSVYVLVHGVIQHGLYHGGQIALLKKAVG